MEYVNHIDSKGKKEMKLDAIKITDGKKGCKICKGTGYYTTHTDRAAEDGGAYSNNHTCKCNKNTK
jgi:hypothetical protein